MGRVPRTPQLHAQPRVTGPVIEGRLPHRGLLGLPEHLMHPGRPAPHHITNPPRPPTGRFAHQLSTAFSDTPNTAATSLRSRPATNAATLSVAPLHGGRSSCATFSARKDVNLGADRK